jgi:hypothetical protein
MKPVVRLRKLRVAGSRRAFLLRSLVDRYVAPPNSEQQRVVAYAAIESHNLWVSFARAFYLSCVLKTTSERGLPIAITAPGLLTPSDGIHYAVRLLKPFVKTGPPFTRRNEPVWHDTNTLLKLFTSVGASNLPQVQASLSYPTTAFAFLPTLRNFFAHRNEETALKAAAVARSLGLSGRLKPTEVLCSILPGRPQNVLADWLDDLRAVMTLLCQ